MNDKLVTSLMKMCDDQIKLLLEQLRDFVGSNITENDYLGLGYTSREAFIDDVVSAMIYIHLNSNREKTIIRNENEPNENTLNARKIVSIKQFVCKRCGTINNFNSNDALESTAANDIDEKSDDIQKIIKNEPSRKKEAILFISKWTIFKLLTELFLYARCWFWGKCERPWYILWNRRAVKSK